MTRTQLPQLPQLAQPPQLGQGLDLLGLGGLLPDLLELGLVPDLHQPQHDTSLETIIGDNILDPRLVIIIVKPKSSLT